jgi:DNA-binding transcriptional regulator YbjK
MPKRVDAARRRDELAALVVRVVESEGADAATFRRIAEAGQFSMGVLTHYFRDKDEMIVCAFDWLARTSFATLKARLASVPPGLGGLQAILGFMVPARGEVTYPGVWLALWSAARHNEALLRTHRNYYARWRALIGSALRAAEARGEVTAAARLPDRVDLLVAGVDGLWLGVVMEAQRYPPARRRRLVAALIRSVTGSDTA